MEWRFWVHFPPESWTMPGVVEDVLTPVARRKQDKDPEVPRDRIDLRADPDWVARVAAAAERFGLSVSAYIRLAVTERMERDEASQPGTRRKRTPPD
jgi:hypothetical protein